MNGDNLIDQAVELDQLEQTDHKRETAKETIAARAAERAAKRAVAQHDKQQQQVEPPAGVFANPNTRGRAHMSSFLPSGSRLQISKRTPQGNTAFVAEYSLQDLAGYSNVQSFVATRLLPNAKPPFEWVAVEVLPSGLQKAPIIITLEPPEDPVSNELKEEVKGLKAEVAKNGSVSHLVQGLKELDEIRQSSAGESSDDIGEFMKLGRSMMFMKAMGEIFSPAPPPMPVTPAGPSASERALEKRLEALERSLDKLLDKLSNPPQQQQSLADTLVAIAKVQEPTTKLLLALVEKKSGGGSGTDEFFKNIQQWKLMGGDSELSQLGGLFGAWMQYSKEKKGEKAEAKKPAPRQIEASSSSAPTAAAAAPAPAASAPATEAEPQGADAPAEFVAAMAALERETDHGELVGWTIKAVQSLLDKTPPHVQKNIRQHMAKVAAAAKMAADGDASARKIVLTLVDELLAGAETDNHITADTRAKVKAAFEARLDEFIGFAVQLFSNLGAAQKG